MATAFPVCLFTDMLKCTYQQSKEVMPSIDAQRLNMINDELWVTGGQGIHIYDKDCKKIREITDQKIQGAAGCVQIDNGDIVVSCWVSENNKGGLHQLNPGGKYIQQIADGAFSDVTTFNNHIYAMDCKINKVNLYQQQKDNKWIQVNEISLTFRNGNGWDKSCVKTTGIYISSADNHCLYHHNLAGKFICTIEIGDQEPGNMNLSIISGIDNPGNVLVTDVNSYCLKIYSTDKTWHTVKLHVGCPIAAVVEENADIIWVINYDHQLFKFSKV